MVKLYKSAVKANEIKDRIKREKMRNKKTKLSSEKVATRAVVMPAEQTDSDNININEVSQEPAPKTTRGAHESIDLTGATDLVEQEAASDSTESKESKVSEILSNANIKKVILIMLLIMFFVPLFDASVYFDDGQDADMFVKNVELLLMSPATQLADIQRLVSTVIADLRTQQPSLVAFCTPFDQFPCFGYEALGNYRSDDMLGSM